MDFNGEDSRSRSGPSFFGAIFMCNRRTKQECFERSLFGLPSSQASFVNRIKHGMVLFLFEYEERKLYGVFRANSDGAMNIKPNAFRSSGKQFPAQVSFKIQWKCHPVSESEFRGAVKDNYYTKEKFGFGLSEDQVHKLLVLFSTRIKDIRLPSKSLTTSTELTRKRGKSGLGNSRRVVTTDRAETKQGRDNGSVRMNSTRYHTSPSPIPLSRRLGSSGKHFSQRDDRDNHLMNVPSCVSYMSGDTQYLYRNSSSLGVDNRATPLHGNTSYSKTSPSSLYLGYRSQMSPVNHLEPVRSIAPEPYTDYIPATHLEPESSIAPTIRYHNPNAIIDGPQEFIPLKPDVGHPEYDYHGSKILAPSNVETHTDHVMPEYSVLRMPAIEDESFERDDIFPSSSSLGSGAGVSPAGVSPARHHEGGSRYWKSDTSTAALPQEINLSPHPQLDYFSRESEKMLGKRLRYVYPTEDIKDYRTHARLHSDTQKPRRSVFSRLAKVKGNNANGNTESDMAVEQLMGELHYQNISRKEMRNSGQPIVHDGDTRILRRRIALDSDDYECSKRKARGSVDHVDDDVGDGKRNPGRFAGCDDDHDTSKRSSGHDNEHHTGKGNTRRATASVEARDIVKNNPKHLTAFDDDHGSSKRISGRSIVCDDGHDTNKIPGKTTIQDDNNVANGEEYIKETDGEEAPLVNYKRRSEMGKGRQGNGIRGCVEGFDLKFVSTNPGKKRKLVRPSFGSGELACGKSAVAGGEGNGDRQDELPQDVGWKRKGNSDTKLERSTHEDIEIGLAGEVVGTNCLLGSKLDQDVRGTYGDHKEHSNSTEKEVGDPFIKTSIEGKTVNICPRSISANDCMKVDRQSGEAVVEECLLTVQRPSQVAVVRVRGHNEALEYSSHEALQDLVDGSLQSQSKASHKVRSLESSAVECFEEEGLAPMLGARNCSLNTEVETKDFAFGAVGCKEMVEGNSMTMVQEHGLSENECKLSMLNCSLTFNVVEDFKEKGKLQIQVTNDQMPKAEWSFQDGMVSTESLKETAKEALGKAHPELTDGHFEPQGNRNEVDLSAERNTGESRKEKALSEGLIAENLLSNRQGFSKDSAVCDVSLQQSTKKSLNIALEEFSGGSFESGHKEKKVESCVEGTCGTSYKEEQSQELIARESLRQLAEESPFCTEADNVKSEEDKGVTDGLLTYDGREIFAGFGSSKPEFSGGKTEGQALHYSIPQSLVKDETTAKMVDKDIGSESEYKPIVAPVTTQSELCGGETEGQVLHHRIPPSLVKDETTAMMVDEDFACEHKCKPTVAPVTTQSESEQRPLRRVKKILKRVKKRTSNPSA